MISYMPQICRNIALILVLSLSLTACDSATNYLKSDREGGLEMQDYKDSLASRMDDETDDERSASASKSLIPDLQPYIAQPQGQMKPMPLVSVSVNQTVPLRDVLFQLAEKAEYDLELDPRIRGAIIFTARERPFDVVIDRISEIAGLRYKFDDDILRIEVDTPYNEIYKIDYLSYIREMKTDISSNIAVVSGDGADTGSGFDSKSESNIDFWGELELNMAQILGTANSRSLATKNTPKVSATAQNPDAEGEAGETPDAVLNVSSLPLDEEEEEAAAGSSAANQGNGFTFALNKQAGMVNVFANQRTHKEVQNYLRELKRSVTAQVLIEAKVLEVTLNDESQTGIDWDFVELGNNQSVFGGFVGPGAALFGSKGLLGSTSTGAAGSTITGGTTGPKFGIGYDGNNFNALLNAIQGFGSVKALASPRITALNNQPAALNVTQNRVYFELEIETSDAGGGGGVQTNVDSEIKNVPVGVIVNVQPSIDLDKGTISMAVRPTITDLVGTGVQDPGVSIAAGLAGLGGTVVSNIPELSVQEVDTVVQLNSGQAIVMGGLLRDKTIVGQEGVPILSEVPIAGNLFKRESDWVQKTELVVFLKATILDNPGDSIHATDKDLYRKFSSDRRPLKF